MKKTALLSMIAFVLAIGVASVSSAKGNHAMAMSGTVSAVDQNAKTFSLKAKDGKETSITWTAATKDRGGSLKDGERVDVIGPRRERRPPGLDGLLGVGEELLREARRDAPQLRLQIGIDGFDGALLERGDERRVYMEPCAGAGAQASDP